MKKLLIGITLLILTLAGCGRGYYARDGYRHHHGYHGYHRGYDDRGYARY